MDTNSGVGASIGRIPRSDLNVARSIPKSLLGQLRAMTTVVADTGDVGSIAKYNPQDATTNPSLIAAAAIMPHYQHLIDQVLSEATSELAATAGESEIVGLAFRRLAVAFGKEILDVIPGRISTEVDARMSFDRAATLAQARDIVRQYDEAGIARERVLVKIASTWEGIQAARILERENIHCNLTLLFGIHQAAACADANVTLVSPFVGRILDWYKKETGLEYHDADDPGVRSVTHIYNYLKKFSYGTLVMAASFRNVDEICQLAGCDLLTISPKLLGELDSLGGALPRMLSPERARATSVERITMDQDTFERMNRNDPMASELLTQGIEGFSTALSDLERLLSDRLATLRSSEKVSPMIKHTFRVSTPT